MTVWFTVQLDDKPGSLARVATALAERGVNITGIVGVAEDTDGALMLTTSDAGRDAGGLRRRSGSRSRSTTPASGSTAERALPIGRRSRRPAGRAPEPPSPMPRRPTPRRRPSPSASARRRTARRIPALAARIAAAGGTLRTLAHGPPARAGRPSGPARGRARDRGRGPRRGGAVRAIARRAGRARPAPHPLARPGLRQARHRRRRRRPGRPGRPRRRERGRSPQPPRRADQRRHDRRSSARRTIAAAVRAVADLPRARLLVLAGSIMGGDISRAADELRAHGIPIIALNMVGSITEARRPRRLRPGPGRHDGRHGDRRHGHVRSRAPARPAVLTARRRGPDAHRDLERQLAQGPPREGRVVARPGRARTSSSCRRRSSPTPTRRSWPSRWPATSSSTTARAAGTAWRSPSGRARRSSDVVTNFGDGPVRDSRSGASVADAEEDFDPFDEARMVAADLRRDPAWSRASTRRTAASSARRSTPGKLRLVRAPRALARRDPRPGRAARHRRRLQRRARPTPTSGTPAAVHGGTHVSEPERAAFRAPARLGPRRRLPAAAPTGARPLHLVGLPGRQLPQELRDADRPPPRHARRSPRRVVGAEIDREARKGKPVPSDHAPAARRPRRAGPADRRRLGRRRGADRGPQPMSVVARRLHIAGQPAGFVRAGP